MRAASQPDWQRAGLIWNIPGYCCHIKSPIVTSATPLRGWDFPFAMSGADSIDSAGLGRGLECLYPVSCHRHSAGASCPPSNWGGSGNWSRHQASHVWRLQLLLLHNVRWLPGWTLIICFRLGANTFIYMSPRGLLALALRLHSWKRLGWLGSSGLRSLWSGIEKLASVSNSDLCISTPSCLQSEHLALAAQGKRHPQPQSLAKYYFPGCVSLGRSAHLRH